MEAAIAGPFPKSEQPSESRHGFFSVINDPRTYGALVYMLLSLATGIFYFTWTITGISLSFGLAVLIIGIPFALLFVASVRLLGHIEGRIVESLLGVRMPRRLPASAGEQTLLTRIKEAFIDARTWSSMLYLVLMLPLGIVYFVIAIVGIAVPLGIVGGSVWSLLTNESHVQIDDLPWLQHLLHTAPGLILLAAAGVLLFFVTLHVARGIGWMHARLAELLLVRL